MMPHDIAIAAKSPLRVSTSSTAIAAKERRHYVRLTSILPLELQLFNGDTHLWLSETLQGYTQDVSEGGLCIEMFHLPADQLRWLSDPALRMHLSVHLPPFRHPVQMTARLAWVEAMHGGAHPHGYRLGIAFETIADADRARLMRYARRVHWLPKIIATSIVILLATVGNLVWHSRANANAQRLLATQVHELGVREETLRHQLASAKTQRQVFERQLREATTQPSPAAQTLSAATPRIVTQTQSALTELTRHNATLQEELRAVSTAKATAEAELLNNLYTWLRVHQYPTTGLLISYEGDSSLEDWAFTYDQALMAQCFLLFGNVDAARKNLAFFATKAQRVNGGFVNAYDAVSGAVREYAVHAGPNIWIGIAALQYTHATGDRQFLPLAQAIAAWVERLQQEDPDGGIRGGPKETWFSTEHNVDAYAFFTMLAQLTGEAKYRADAERVLQWLKQNAHGRLAGQINRGRGDATIATDTFAWAVAALGPALLQQIGFDPDAVMAFAEEHCAVKAAVTRPDKTRVTVEGFDFSKPKHVARGGVVSTEWTGQMVVAMKMMEQYHRAAGRLEQAESYRAKAVHYEEELAKLIISSPCPLGHAGWALPYASHGDVDTGHGWRTAHGNSTGSTSGTVYHIFARTGFNPLQLNDKPLHLAASTHDASSPHRTP